MARTAKPLTFRMFMIDTEKGETYRWDELTEEQKEEYRRRMNENLGKRMSIYYGEHIDQFERL